jgi:hypothetical protein
MKNIWPFYIIHELQHFKDLASINTHKPDVNILAWVIKGIIAFMGLMFLYLGLLFNNLRIKNNIIREASKKLTDIVSGMQQELNAKKPSNNLQSLEAKDLPFNEE